MLWILVCPPIRMSSELTTKERYFRRQIRDGGRILSIPNLRRQPTRLCRYQYVPFAFLLSPSPCVSREIVLITTVVTSPHAPGTDYTLNNIFTCLYGWIAILAAFLLATLCVIKEVRQIMN
jgi:hypothetical protein